VDAADRHYQEIQVLHILKQLSAGSILSLLYGFLLAVDTSLHNPHAREHQNGGFVPGVPATEGRRRIWAKGVFTAHAGVAVMQQGAAHAHKAEKCVL